MDKREQRSSANECDLIRLSTVVERLRMENQLLQLERDNAHSKINLIEATQQENNTVVISVHPTPVPSTQRQASCLAKKRCI